MRTFLCLFSLITVDYLAYSPCPKLNCKLTPDLFSLKLLIPIPAGGGDQLEPPIGVSFT